MNAWHSKKKVLDNISISLNESEIVGILGGSGSGKTSLFFSILGLSNWKKINYKGEIIHYKKILPVFQDPILYFNPKFTLGEVLLEPFKLNFPEKSKNDSIEIILMNLKKFKVQSELNRNITSFSGGELQKISMIRTLICEPNGLIMDEPVSGLDSDSKNEVKRMIEDLKKQSKGFLIISHNLDFIEEISSRVYVMNEGKIVEEGDTELIFNLPKSEYTKQFLDSRVLKLK